MTQRDIALCLVELERLWQAQLASGNTRLAYPVDDMIVWANASGVPHDPFNPWYQRDYSRLRARLLQANG